MPTVYPHACTLRLPVALAEAVQRTAAAQGVTRAELIRTALRAALTPTSGRRSRAAASPAPSTPSDLGDTLASLDSLDLGNLDDLLGEWGTGPSSR